MVLPYAWASGSAKLAGQPQDREVSGPGDPRFRVSVNLFGAQYDADKLLNIGTNRWSVKPEVGISRAWGPVTLELAPSVTFYTKNDDFLGKTREQDPLYAVQGHLTYSFGFGVWAALDATYYTGGRTTVDGVKSDDRQENTRVGVTFALPVDRRNSVKVNASTGAISRTGGDFTTVGVAWQFRWGGGL